MGHLQLSRLRLAATGLALILAAGSALLAQQTAGDTLIVVGTATSRPLPAAARSCESGAGEFQSTDPYRELAFRSAVAFEEQLETAPGANLVLDLVDGNEFAMAQNSIARICPLELWLEDGAIRIVAIARQQIFVDLSRPGAPSETVVAQAEGTSFLAACGAPATSSDACLFVGIYGTTRVTASAFPDQPQLLGPQRFTVVRSGTPPTAGQLMEDVRFFRLIDSTTVVGSGQAADRLEPRDVAPDDESARVRFEPPRRHPPGQEPPRNIPVDPAKPPDLVDPPPPPNPPRR